MSFLGGGDASCSTGANPLAQFQKHVHDDRSLQRDRLVGRGPEAARSTFRSNGGRESGNEMMDEFLQRPGGIPQTQPFAMDHMRGDFDKLRGSRTNGSPGWATEFDPDRHDPAQMEAAFMASPNASFSAAEFQSFNRTSGPVAAAPQAFHSGYSSFQRPFGMGYGSMYGGMGGSGTIMMPMAVSNMQTTQNQDQKGKGRMVELDDQDWEAQFAELELDAQKEENQDSLDKMAEEAMEAQLNDIDRKMAETEHDLSDGQHWGDLGDWENFDTDLNTHLRTPEMGNYMFEEDNIFKDTADPFSEGVRIMDQGGNLSLAALAFEAAVQKDPDHVEAWTRLGAAQAQNEKETPAIRALERAIALDPSNLDALMNLAVSYTNEGYDTTAYRTLERWLSAKYPQIAPPDANAREPDMQYDLGFTDRELLRKKIVNQFLDAARLSPDAEHMDPDVQVGLGVLFYGTEEYDNAVDCFNAALASAESGTTNSNTGNQRALLWNRLGATMANSGNSEEAITAYEKALELNPNFVRARYNLGVSCINIGCHKEAAQHLLGALDMHRVVEHEAREKAREIVAGGPGNDKGAVGDEDLDRIIRHNHSTNLYDTLRRALIVMGRRDLSEKVGPGMDPRALMNEVGVA